MITLLSLLITSASAQIAFHVQATPVADLIYQIDCVSGVENHCSTQNFTKLWQDKFLKTDSQRDGLKKWRQLREQIDNSVRHEEESDFDMPRRFHIASEQARTFDDFFVRLDLLLATNTKMQVRDVLSLYWPAFESWWKKDVAPISQPMVAKTSQLLKGSAVQRRLAQFQKFYRAPLPAGFVSSLALIYRPIYVQEAGSGSVNEAYSHMEFHSKEKPSHLLDVVIHEFCHFLYGLGDDELRISLKKRFFDLKTSEAIAAYGLLNESLATVFGNGMFVKETSSPAEWATYLAREKSFYNDVAIDTSAKALLPFMESYLRDGGTLYDDAFASSNVRVLSSALGGALTAPGNILREAVDVTDFREAQEIGNLIRSVLSVSSLHGAGWDLDGDQNYTYFLAHPEVSALFVIRSESLKKIGKHGVLSADVVRLLGKREGPFVYAVPRGTGAMTYVLVAPDLSQVKAELETLAKVDKGFVGFM